MKRGTEKKTANMKMMMKNKNNNNKKKKRRRSKEGVRLVLDWRSIACNTITNTYRKWAETSWDGTGRSCCDPNLLWLPMHVGVLDEERREREREREIPANNWFCRRQDRARG